MVEIRITGYGHAALSGGPFTVAQTGERIGRRVPTVAARAVAYAQSREWSAIARLLARSPKLHLSTDYAGSRGASLVYGSACLVEFAFDGAWRGMGSRAALAAMAAQS